MATIKKAQTGKNVPKGMVESEMTGKFIPKSKSNYETGKSIGKPAPAPKKPAPAPKKAKKGAKVGGCMSCGGKMKKK